MRRALACVVLATGFCALLLWSGAIPSAWNPFRPLDVRAPLNPVTPIKLRLLTASPRLCRAALRTAGLSAIPVPDDHPAPGCGLTDAVRVSGGGIALNPSSFLASCPLAVDWALFTRQVLQPLATRDLGARATAIHHLGSYNCRDVRGGTNLSAHATANAIDLAGVTLADGQHIAVADWSDGNAKSAFLHRLRNGACRVFGVVLSPDFNADHRSHFHLQATGWGLCR